MDYIRSSLWHFRFPGMIDYADARFIEPVTENQARYITRMRLGMTRLPRGTEFWK